MENGIDFHMFYIFLQDLEKKNSNNNKIWPRRNYLTFIRNIFWYRDYFWKYSQAPIEMGHPA